jgi:hypothetical protein
MGATFITRQRREGPQQQVARQLIPAENVGNATRICFGKPPEPLAEVIVCIGKERYTMRYNGRNERGVTYTTKE